MIISIIAYVCLTHYLLGHVPRTSYSFIRISSLPQHYKNSYSHCTKQTRNQRGVNFLIQGREGQSRLRSVGLHTQNWQWNLLTWNVLPGTISWNIGSNFPFPYICFMLIPPWWMLCTAHLTLYLQMLICVPLLLWWAQ